MNRVQRLRLSLGVFWILGSLLTLWMTLQFFALRTMGGAFHSLCNIHDVFNCDRVFLSKWAELLPGVPLSSLAAAWFLSGFSVFWQGRREEKARASFQIQAWMGLFGTLFGSYYFFVMALQLKTLCIFCLGVDLLNASILVLSLSAMPRKDWFLPIKLLDLGVLALKALPSCLVILGFWSYGQMLMPAIEPQDIERYLNQFLAQPRKALTSASTSAMRIGTPGAVIQIHEFSDFQCPFCREGAKLFHRMLERFPGKIEVHFHNVPLSSKCNPRVSVDYHTAACQAAKAAVCGSWQGQFEAVYMRLFDVQERLEMDKVLALLTDLPLDHSKMARCLLDPDTQAAVSRDLTLADQLGINGVTPTFLIQGYPLQGILPFAVLDALIRKLLDAPVD